MDVLVARFAQLSATDRAIFLDAVAVLDAEEANRPIVDHKIAADLAMVHAKLAEARAQQIKTIELASETIFEPINLCIKKIQPGERIRVTLPPSETHFNVNSCEVNWHSVQEIAREFEGPQPPDNVFVVLRYNDHTWTAIVADIYRAPA